MPMRSESQMSCSNFPDWPTRSAHITRRVRSWGRRRETKRDSMKTEAPLPEEHAAPASVIDTSKMSPEQRAALEMTEAAREVKGESFAGGLFMGRFDLGALHPYPVQSVEDRDQGDAFIERLGAFLKEKADPDEIDATGEIPPEVFEGLARLG